MFSSQIGLKPLALTCRSLSTLLESGVSLPKALRVAAEKSGDARTRQALQEIAGSIQRGDDVSTAVRDLRDVFPELFLDMVELGEQTGSLPEILRSLADHYDNQLRLRKTFLSGIAWPAFELTAAILIIAGVILIMGWIAETRSTTPVDPLGWGLVGVSGAVVWLTGTFGTFLALFVLYQMVRRSLQGKQFLDPLLLQVPVLGPCLQSFAIARFSWAFALTQQSGMPIRASLETSLKATGNGAFLATAPRMWNKVRTGESLSEAFSASGLFPPDYLEMVHVAETSGTVPEMLDHMSPQFEEQARRSLGGLVTALSWVVWGLVAAFIIFVVFSIVLWYIGLLNEALEQTTVLNGMPNTE